MYLGRKKSHLNATDNGIVASVAQRAEDLFVPEAWGHEEVTAEPVGSAEWEVEPSLVSSTEVENTEVARPVMS